MSDFVVKLAEYILTAGGILLFTAIGVGTLFAYYIAIKERKWGVLALLILFTAVVIVGVHDGTLLQ